MKAAPPLLIHVGYHKTGSTWLQQDFFQPGRCGFTTPDGAGPKAFPARHLIYGGRNGLWSPMDYDAAAVRAAYDDAVSGAEQPVVLSHEDLVAHVYNGGVFIGVNAANLHRSFPQARVLLVVRRQQALLRSAYGDFLEDGGIAGLDAFMTPRNENQIPFFTPAYLEFDRAVALYRELFGPDRVLVLPYEGLCEDPVGFLRRVLDFAGGRCPEPLLRSLCERVTNPSVGQRVALLSWLPWLNLLGEANNNNARGALGWRGLRRAIVHYGAKLVPARAARRRRRAMETRIGDALGERFRASNQRLATMLDWDPAAYGYDC